MSASDTNSALAPDLEMIEAHLDHITRRWDEVGEPCLLEVVFLTPEDVARVRDPRRFRLDQIPEAAAHVAAMNERRLNAYAVVNPVRASAQIETGRRASAEHIAAALFHWADADSAEAADNIRDFVGPRCTFSVITGTKPSLRPHVYWELEEPSLNLAAWSATQRAIAQTLRTDPSVVDPPRIMRLGGTINWPKPQKQAKGYVPELTLLRVFGPIERPPVSSERMARAFVPAQGPAPGQDDPRARRTAEHFTDLLRRARTDGEKHGGVRDLAAHLAGSGVARAMAGAIIRDACPVWDDNVEALIASAYAKFYRADRASDAQEATDEGWQAGPPQDDPSDPGAQPDERDGGRGRPGAASPPPRASRFLRVSELHGLPIPPREWIVPGLIPQSTVTLLGGDGGTGKSLIAGQLAVAGASEGRWLGLEVMPGGVLYLSAEDDLDELHRRMADIAMAEGLSLADLDRLTIRSLAGEDALLAADGLAGLSPTALYAEVDAEAAAIEDLRLIVLDTAADLHSANENDRAKVRAFIGLLRGLAIRHRCGVLLLAHPSLTGLSSGSGLSGSTAWNNSVRSRLYFERIVDRSPEGDHEPDPNRRRLRTMKSNYGPVGGEVLVGWRQGVFVPEVPPIVGKLDRMAAGAKAERVFLKLLDEFTAQGRYVSPNPSAAFGPTVFTKAAGAEGMTKRALTGAMEALFARGVLTVRQHGRGASKRDHIARSDTPAEGS